MKEKNEIRVCKNNVLRCCRLDISKYCEACKTNMRKLLKMFLRASVLEQPH